MSTPKITFGSKGATTTLFKYPLIYSVITETQRSLQALMEHTQPDRISTAIPIIQVHQDWEVEDTIKELTLPIRREGMSLWDQQDSLRVLPGEVIMPVPMKQQTPSITKHPPLNSAIRPPIAIMYKIHPPPSSNHPQRSTTTNSNIT